MEWQNLVAKLRIIKEEFDKSYKCLNLDRPTKNETINKHIEILLRNLEKTRVVLNVNYNRLTVAHRAAADAFFIEVRNKLIYIAKKKGIDLELPTSLHEETPLYFNLKQQTSANMTTFNIETVSKTLPLFTGNYQELESFLITCELINKTLSDTAKTDLLQYIYHAKLTSNVRTAIGTYIKPEKFEDLKKLLKEKYKNNKTIPELQTRLNTTYQGKMPISSYKEKILTIIDNMNSLGIEELGNSATEAEKNVIIRLNNKLALDTFKKGLNENFKSTVYAARPENIHEAYELALELENENRTNNSSILHVNTYQPRYQRQNHYEHNTYMRQNNNPNYNRSYNTNNRNNNNNSNRNKISNSSKNNNNTNNNFSRRFNNNNINNNNRRNQNYTNRNNRYIHTIQNAGNEMGQGYMVIPEGQN